MTGGNILGNHDDDDHNDCDDIDIDDGDCARKDIMCSYRIPSRTFFLKQLSQMVMVIVLMLMMVTMMIWMMMVTMVMMMMVVMKERGVVSPHVSSVNSTNKYPLPSFSGW